VRHCKRCASKNEVLKGIRWKQQGIFLLTAKVVFERKYSFRYAYFSLVSE